MLGRPTKLAKTLFPVFCALAYSTPVEALWESFSGFTQNPDGTHSTTQSPSQLATDEQDAWSGWAESYNGVSGGSTVFAADSIDTTPPIELAGALNDDEVQALVNALNGGNFSFGSDDRNWSVDANGNVVVRDHTGNVVGWGQAAKDEATARWGENSLLGRAIQSAGEGLYWRGHLSPTAFFGTAVDQRAFRPGLGVAYYTTDFDLVPVDMHSQAVLESYIQEMYASDPVRDHLLKYVRSGLLDSFTYLGLYFTGIQVHSGPSFYSAEQNQIFLNHNDLLREGVFLIDHELLHAGLTNGLVKGMIAGDDFDWLSRLNEHFFGHLDGYVGVNTHYHSHGFGLQEAFAIGYGYHKAMKILASPVYQSRYLPVYGSSEMVAQRNAFMSTVERSDLVVKYQEQSIATIDAVERMQVLHGRQSAGVDYFVQQFTDPNSALRRNLDRIAGDIPVVTNPLFDAELYIPSQYRALNPDLAGMNNSQLAQHWLQHGVAQGRQASLNFSSLDYLLLNEDLLPTLGWDFRRALEHYAFYGRLQNREGLMLTSPKVYNSLHYRSLNPDLAHLTNVQLAKHWLDHGIEEGRQANLFFRVTDYLALSPDLEAHYGGNLRQALEHYMRWGRHQGREVVMLTNPLVFNVNYYRALNQDLAHLDNVGLAAHWIHHGIDENRQAVVGFRPGDYITLNQDVSHAFLNNHRHAIAHYVQWGHEQQREGSINFHPVVFNMKYYRALNQDLAHLDNVDLAAHWIHHGVSEGRQATLRFLTHEFAALNPDLEYSHDNWSALWHYAVWAHQAGRAGAISTNPLVFNPSSYRIHNPSLADWSNPELTRHWLTSGKNSGLRGTTAFSSWEYHALYPDLQIHIGLDHHSLIHHFVIHGHPQGRRGKF